MFGNRQIRIPYLLPLTLVLLPATIARPQTGALITGSVVDDTSGAALPRSEVRVLGQRALAIDVAAKDDGTFQTSDLPSGDYTVAAWSPGYVPTTTFVHHGKEMAPLHIRLVRLGTIEGQLKGLQGWTAKVLALTRSRGKKTGLEIWKLVLENSDRGVSVDGDGRFRIRDLPPGSYALLVSYSNSGIIRYPDRRQALELKGDGATVTVQIPIPPDAASRTVEGRVELPDSQTWYWVTLSDPERPALAVATAVSGDKGAFAFRGVVPGVYELLAVPGEGEIGTRSAKPPFHGFARVPVDLREHDARGVKITPQQAIKVSVALSEARPTTELHDRCLVGLVTLMPIEDWGVDLKRRASGVNRISDNGSLLVPESTDGLAPAKYGVSVESRGCLVADDPVLDLTKALTGSVEATINEPGTVRGRAEAGTEVILIPEDFAEGWSYARDEWFSESAFGAELYFRLQGFATIDDENPPHVRITVANTEGYFEFGHVPVGGYRIGLRAAGSPTDGKGMKEIQVSPAGITEADLTVADVNPPTSAPGK